MMKKQLGILVTILFLFTAFWTVAQTPDSFLTHKVKKGETLDWIIARYQITAEQLKAYNPSLERFGIRRKMNLRIPVFSTVVDTPKTESNTI